MGLCVAAIQKHESVLGDTTGERRKSALLTFQPTSFTPEPLLMKNTPSGALQRGKKWFEEVLKEVMAMRLKKKKKIMINGVRMVLGNTVQVKRNWNLDLNRTFF